MVNLSRRSSVLLALYYSLVIALLGGLLPTAQAARGCFDESNPPTCSAPPSDSTVASTVDAQAVCARLDLDNLWGVQFFLSLHAQYLSNIPENSPFCQQVRQAYHLCYWCTPNISRVDYCWFKSCDAPSEIDETVDLQATCAELDAMAARFEFPATKDLCYRAEHAKHLCPTICQVLPAYMGANSTARKQVLLWMPRVAAMLSFIGACYILWDVLSHEANRKTVYHQLLVGMACFDICTAAAWSFSDAPVPDDEGWWVEGAKGNDHTCTAQAFFVQLGFTSVFYNGSLAMYYLLVIVYNWREGRLKRIRFLLHGIPLLVGLGLALGGIPIYDWSVYGCHLEPVTRGDNPWKVLVFAVIPIFVSIAFITGAMILLYVSVRKKSRRSEKWGGSGDMEKRVLWQAIFYSLSFFITWPILIVVYLFGVDLSADNYWFTLIVAFVMPLQGFTNFLVYIRPRALKVENLARATRRMSSLLRSGSQLQFWKKEGAQEAIDTSSSSMEPSALVDSSAQMDPSVLIAQGSEDLYADVIKADATQEEEEEDDCTNDQDDVTNKVVMDPLAVDAHEKEEEDDSIQEDDTTDEAVIASSALIALGSEDVCVDAIQGDATHEQKQVEGCPQEDDATAKEAVQQGTQL